MIAFSFGFSLIPYISFKKVEILCYVLLKIIVGCLFYSVVPVRLFIKYQWQVMLQSITYFYWVKHDSVFICDICCKCMVNPNPFIQRFTPGNADDMAIAVRLPSFSGYMLYILQESPQQAMSLSSI